MGWLGMSFYVPVLREERIVFDFQIRPRYFGTDCGVLLVVLVKNHLVVKAYFRVFSFYGCP